LLPGPAATGVQEATAVGPLVSVLQVVAVQLLPAFANAGLQVGVGVAPLTTVLQIVCV
jgi:hypothetical protein